MPWTETLETVSRVRVAYGRGGEYPLDPEQYLEVGETRSFEFEPDEGYQLVKVDSTCDGERVGNTYTVTANRDNCRLDATFSLEAFSVSVTPAIAGAGGQIRPSTSMSYPANSTASFTLIPDDGFQILSVDGSCGGVLTGDVYTTNTLSADCTVEAKFKPNPSLLLASADNGGSISPESVSVEFGDTAVFDITPDEGYRIDAVTGSCGGELAGSTYTTAPVESACSVEVSFERIPEYMVSISVGAGGSSSYFSSGQQTVPDSVCEELAEQREFQALETRFIQSLFAPNQGTEMVAWVVRAVLTGPTEATSRRTRIRPISMLAQSWKIVQLISNLRQT